MFALSLGPSAVRRVSRSKYSFRFWVLLLLLFVSALWRDGRASARADASAVSPIVGVSAASFQQGRPVAPGSLVAAFTAGVLPGGTFLQATDAIPNTPAFDLPTLLGNFSAEVHGRSVGIVSLVNTPSYDQFNILIPPDLAPGKGPIVIKSSSGQILAAGEIEVAPVTPAIFTANSAGSGVPAALLYRYRKGVPVGVENVFLVSPETGQLIPRPIDLGSADDDVFLVLFLTGISRLSNPNDTRILIGGEELIPLSVGAQGFYAGLDQVNVLLSRSLRGRLTLAFAAIGHGTSNLCEIEVAPPSNSPPSVFGLSKAEALAGELVEVTGTGFSSDSEVLISDSNRKLFNAKIMEVRATSLKVLVPYGAGTGNLVVRNLRGEASFPFKMRTSMSGIVQTSQRQQDGSERRVGVRNVTIRLRNSNLPPVQTGTDGSFLMPDVPPTTPLSSGLVFEVDGTTNGALPLAKEVRRIRVVSAGRDNPFPEYIELKPESNQSVPTVAPGVLANGAFAFAAQAHPGESELTGQTGQVVFEPNGSTVQLPGGQLVNPLKLTVLDTGRTPADLPFGQYSSTIVQLSPFGAQILPGGKLTFPNTDGLTAGKQVNLFRFDQTVGSNTIGQFVIDGTARVSADGLRIETASNAVKESTYYFASDVWPTTTIYGKVAEEDDSPARGALVQVRGQSIFSLTDQNGSFYLVNVPVVGDSAFTIEVSFLRPDGTVDRTERSGVLAGAGGITFVSPPIKLPGQGRTRAPVILAPKGLSIEAGKTSDFSFLAYARVVGQTLQPVVVSGAPFASILSLGNDRYTLRLAPSGGATGNYSLVLTATDGQPLTTMETIDLEVKAAGNTAPIANSQSAVTNEDTPLNLTLTGSGGTAFRIVNSPLHGKLEGTPPSLVYRPNQDFNGSDSFSFALGNGSIESAPAVVSIAVQPVDDRPLLEVGNSFSTNIGQPLNFVITGRDGDTGQTLTLTTTGLPPGSSVTQTTATSWLFDWTPNSTQIGSFSVGLLLKDNGTPSQSDTKTVAITVDAKWARSPGLDGGLIQCFVVIGNTIFAGTDLGGIFRSTDNGASWAPSGLSNQDVQALVTSGTTIFAATNRGVFRSTDNGSGWSEVTNGLPRNPSGPVRAVLALVVSGNAILAGTAGGGVYRTTDSGGIWTDSSAGLPKFADMSFRSVYSLLTSGNNVFAGTSGGIYRSTDGGANWSAANSGIPTTTDGLYRSVFALVGTPGGIFAAIFGDGVFRSTNNGASWTPVNNGLTDPFVRSLLFTGGSLYTGTSGSGVFVSGDSGATWTQRGLPDQIVYALAVGGGTIFAGTYSSIFRTADGGINWTRGGNGLSNLFAYANLVVGNSIFTGTDDGVYRSTDNGASWVRTGLQGTVVIGLSLGGNTIFATASGGLVYRSLDGGASWIDISNAIDFLGLNDLIVVGNAFLASTSEGIYRSIDNGMTWNQFGTGLATSSNGAFRPVYALLAKGNTLFAGTLDAGIYRSTDGGATWTQTSNGLPKDSEGLFRAVAELLSPGNAILAGTLAGGLYRSIDNGVNWTAVTNGFDATSVQTLAVGGNVIYAGTNNKGVFRSTDDGASWSPSGLSGLLWVYQLATSGGSIFAATTEGTFVLAESALAWSESNAGLANKFINAATLGSFLVGTYNGGVFSSADDAQNWQPSNSGLPPAADVRAFVKTGTGTFAGVAGAGVYLSSDQGQNWSARNNGLSNLQVNALATDGTTLWAGTDDGVFRSTDSGQNWSQINSGLTRLHVLSLSASGAGVFAGTDNGLFRFNSATTNWSPANSGLSDLYVLSLGVAPNGTALLAGTANGLFRSTNQGQNWAKVASGISEKVVAFVFLQGGTKLLAGTVSGVYLSDDNGASWIVYNTGLLNPQVSALAAKDKLVVAGTRGSGVFVSQIPDVLTNHPPTLSLSCPNVQTVAIGTPINCTISASDPDANQSQALTAGGLPAGATFNPNTGAFVWTPSAIQTGIQTIAFTATDNGSPRLASSRELTITVNNPTPVLSNLSPSSTGAGGVAFPLNIVGSGFVANSIVRWNGNGRPTNYISPTQLSATIPATDIASIGTAAVSVFNPTPGGGASNSLTFTIGSPCNFSITPPGQQFSAASGTGTVNVTATSGCAWTAVSNATSFVTITAGASGTGNGSVSYSVAANTSATARQGTMTIAGQTFTVMQAGQPQATELAVDDGTFETNVGINVGGIYGFVNRLSPSSYPATLTGISIFIPAGIPVDKRFNLIWGSITASDTDINVVSFQEVEVRVLASGQFNVFTLTTPFTITSGDFVVGCRFEHDQGQFPAALDRTASKGRSFQSINRGSWGLIDSAPIGAGNWGIRARITGQQAGINELALDDGTFEQTLGAEGGGYTRVLNRFTPTSYPIVAKGVSIFFPPALTAGKPVILLIGKIASGATDLSSVVFQQVNVTVQTPGQFNVYTIPDLSVTSGDLLLGFRADHGATEYPVANDRTLPRRGRSYYSGNGGAFQLIDAFAGYEGNFGIRARVMTGSGLQLTVD